MSDISIVIPAFNRIGPLRQTLHSAAAALRHHGRQNSELLLVDDGSAPPLREQLAGEDFGWPIRHLVQSNQGSIVARHTGLLAAQGEWVLFLDSDDLIPADKLARQLEPAITAATDIVYGNMARAHTGPAGAMHYEAADILPRTSDTVDFFLQVQPAPHNPVYRRSYLMAALAQPVLPSERRFDPAGDAWLYYNLCIHPARIHKVDAPVAAAGVHAELRYSLHWEKLGVAALGIMEGFMAHCPPTEASRAARIVTGERAFLSWRALPRGFNADFERRMLAVWQHAPRGSLGRLGEKRFVALARILGPERAARVLRWRNAPYGRVRTLDEQQYATLFKPSPRP